MSLTGLVLMGLGLSILLTWLTILFKTLQFAKARRASRRYAFDDSTRLPLFNSGFPEIIPGRCRNDDKSTSILINRPHGVTGNESRRKSYLRVVEKTLNQQVEQEIRRLEQGLTILACIGSVTPFVGLLGTVLGIMEALGSLGPNNAVGVGHVAGPIGHALLTTAVGIGSAVPAVLAYNGVIPWIRLYQTDLHAMVTEILIEYYLQCHVHRQAGTLSADSSIAT